MRERAQKQPGTREQRERQRDFSGNEQIPEPIPLPRPSRSHHAARFQRLQRTHPGRLNRRRQSEHNTDRDADQKRKRQGRNIHHKRIRLRHRLSQKYSHRRDSTERDRPRQKFHRPATTKRFPSEAVVPAVPAPPPARPAPQFPVFARSRVPARRFATFAHAMSNTSPTAPNKIKICDEKSPIEIVAHRCHDRVHIAIRIRKFFFVALRNSLQIGSRLRDGHAFLDPANGSPAMRPASAQRFQRHIERRPQPVRRPAVGTTRASRQRSCTALRPVKRFDSQRLRDPPKRDFQNALLRIAT